MLQRRAIVSLILIAIVLVGCSATPAFTQDADPAPRRKSVLDDPNFFPLAVWVQSPKNAARYKAAGINLYVGLWNGPTDEHLAALKEHGLFTICSQNATGLARKDDPTIVAWMHGDEPDNAQRVEGQKGWGPPILPEKIIADYERLKARDPSRPVLLNLGQGVAWDQYIGRGVRRNHPEDYPEYVKGSDIASFDIYPACHDHPDVAGKLWFVADGVSRLKKWAGDTRRVWNCIECTRISNENTKATPKQVKAEVWMSLIRGSQGIIYFCHQFKPRFIEAGLLADEAMLAAVTATNHQIQSLAPVLNSPSLTGLVSVESSTPSIPVEAMVKQHRGSTYIFAVGMRDGKTSATFRLAGMKNAASVEVLGENRTIPIAAGAFTDTFDPWAVHLYRLESPRENSGFEFRPDGEKSLALYEHNRPVLVYNHGPIAPPGSSAGRGRACYFHPIYGLDGEILTDDFPKDHTYHRGLYFAWPHIKIGDQEYELWTARGDLKQTFRRITAQHTSQDHATLGIENAWTLAGKPVVGEQLQLRVHAARDGARSIDVEATWTPLDQPLTLSGAEGKSYGGFNFRFGSRDKPTIIVPAETKLPEGVTASDGRVSGDLLMTKLPWANFTARFDNSNGPGGAAIFVDPRHPDFPPTWMARHYGLMSVGWPGVEPQTFPAGKPITCRYSLWIHRGTKSASEIQNAYTAWSSAKN